jgi:hypothetical protein
MSQQAYQPDYYIFDNFEISAIIFDESDGVTVCGYADIDGETGYINMFCTFQQLNEILNVPVPEAEKVLTYIADMLSTGLQENPIVVNVEEITSDFITMDKFHFVVYEPEITIGEPLDDDDDEEEEDGQDANEEDEMLAEDKKDLINDTACYLLDRLIRVEPTVELEHDEESFESIYEELSELYIAYQKYLLVLDQGYSKEQAQLMFRLDNPILLSLLEKLYMERGEE